MTDRKLQKDVDQKCWSKYNLKQQRQHSRRERGESREGAQDKREQWKATLLTTPTRIANKRALRCEE